MTRLPSLLVAVMLSVGAGCPSNSAAPPSSSAQATPSPASESTSVGGSASATSAPDAVSATGDSPTTAPLSQDDRAVRLFEAGSRALSARPPDHAEAAARLEDAVRADDGFAEAWYNLGLALTGQGRLAEAIRALEKATFLKPQMAGGWTALGDALLRSGQPDAAANAYEQGIRQSPGDAGLRTRLVDVFRRQGQTDKAVSQAKEVLKINSNSVEAYNNLGLVYMDAGENELARFVFVKALNSLPEAQTTAAIHANLGLVHFRLGNSFAAETSLAEALKLDPNLVGALVSMSYIRLRNLDHAGARELLERAVSKEPESVEVHLNLGVAKRGMGDYPGAKAEYERVLALSPGNAAARFDLAVLYGDFLKEYDQAIAAYKEYLKAPNLSAATEKQVRKYIDDMEKTKVREERRKERERRRKEQDSATPDPAPEAGTGTGGSP